MKAAVLVCFVLAVLSLTGAAKISKPSSSLAPAVEFNTDKTTAAPNTTTPEPKTTTIRTTTKPTTPAHTTTTTPAHTTTTTPAQTNTTTPAHANTTTPAQTNTTTPAHAHTTTTTPAHTTTTTPAHANTTTPAHTNTTTPAHTTTTTSAHTTTTPPPTPSSNVTAGNYTLKNSKGQICLMAVMALQIRLQTAKFNNTFTVQPKMTNSSGGCEDTKANLTLVFDEGFITFLYNKSTDNSTASVTELSFRLSLSSIRGGNADYTADNKTIHLFTARVGHSYSCRSESLYMGKGLYLDVTQDRMQAFNLTTAGFGTPDHCPADKPDYRVAIGVGVTLLVLIVVVVVVYLVGRRRRTGGYQPL